MEARSSLKMAHFFYDTRLQGIMGAVFSVQDDEYNHSSLQARLIEGIGHSDCKQLSTTEISCHLTPEMLKTEENLDVSLLR